MTTPKLRWYSSRKEVTAAQVAAERKRTNEPFMVCKSRLEARTGPTLQYWITISPADKDYDECGYWEDVPSVGEVYDVDGKLKE